MAEILSLEGHRVPPRYFVELLERFDPNLRIVWGLSQAVPFAGWVIERKIPGHMKEKVYNRKDKPGNRPRFADQKIVDDNDRVIGRRQYDMMPDWHPVYRIMDEYGSPITDLGEFVIDYLRKNYERTLLGFPELSARHHDQDLADRAFREDLERETFLENVGRKVLEHKYSVWPEYFAFGPQATTIKEGTTFDADNNDGSGEGTSGENAGSSQPS